MPSVLRVVTQKQQQLQPDFSPGSPLGQVTATVLFLLIIIWYQMYALTQQFNDRLTNLEYYSEQNLAAIAKVSFAVNQTVFALKGFSTDFNLTMNRIEQDLNLISGEINNVSGGTNLDDLGQKITAFQGSFEEKIDGFQGSFDSKIPEVIGAISDVNAKLVLANTALDAVVGGIATVDASVLLTAAAVEAVGAEVAGVAAEVLAFAGAFALFETHFTLVVGPFNPFYPGTLHEYLHDIKEDTEDLVDWVDDIIDYMLEWMDAFEEYVSVVPRMSDQLQDLQDNVAGFRRETSDSMGEVVPLLQNSTEVVNIIQQGLSSSVAALGDVITNQLQQVSNQLSQINIAEATEVEVAAINRKMTIILRVLGVLVPVDPSDRPLNPFPVR